MRLLVIQTAFLGDVILATSVIEKLHQTFPSSQIDFLLRQGNEEIFTDHPYINTVWILNKKGNKLKNIFSLVKKLKEYQYDRVLNINRFGSSGFITWRIAAKEKTGFDKNPFSFCYTNKIKHEIGNGKHEIQRNHELIAAISDAVPAKPRLYPSPDNYSHTERLGKGAPYICIAPASVWFTKQFPLNKWVALINSLKKGTVFLIGGKNDSKLCQEIIRQSTVSEERPMINLAGKLSVLETAALMQKAKMNYVNDSAPLHIASAVNAPVTAIYCSTISAFGFGPLSDRSKIVETKEKLDCRPCGLHGYKSCPKGHFACAESIEIKDILDV